MNWRTIGVWTCVVLGSFLTLTTVLNVWVEQQILSKSGWTSTSDKLLADPAVQQAAADALITQIAANVNLQELIAKRFPRAAAVAPVAEVQIQDLMQKAAADALASPPAAKAWRAANAVAHDRAVAVLRGKALAGGPLSTEQGQIVIDLRPIVQTLRGRLGIKAQGSDPNAGRIVLFSESGLQTARIWVSVVDALNAWLGFAAVGLFALAVWLARPPKRRGVVMASGFALFGIGLVLLVARRVGIHGFAPRLAATDSGKAAAVSTAEIVTSILRDISLFVLLIGLLALAWAWLAGDSSHARRLRRAMAPVARERPAALHLVVVFLFVLVVLWGPAGTIPRFSGVLVLLAAILIGTEAIRRQAVRDFPDAKGVAISLPARKAPPAPRLEDHLASLERLGALRERGVLTDEEFARSKEQVLVGAGVLPSAPEAKPPAASDKP